MAGKYKLPISVLVVIYTSSLEVLLLERAGHPGYWQSVTGSQNEGETLAATAIREVNEETDLNTRCYFLHDWETENVFEIFEEWRHRYAPGVTHNTEHVFSLRLPHRVEIRIAPREHRQAIWLPYEEAAAKVFSYSNAEAIRRLPQIELQQWPQNKV